LVLSRDEHCGKGTTLEGEREANPEAAGDHAEIAMKQWQCREGHANVGGGNAMLMPAGIPVPGPKGRVIAPKTGFWTMHNVVLSAAVFNVRTATCCYVCSDCCGYSCPDVFIDPDIDVPIEDEFGAGTSVEDFTGNTDDCTESASWTGDAGAEIEGIVGGEAQFTATALGETDVEGELFPVDVPFEGNPFDCPCGCPTGDLIAAAPVEVVNPNDQCGDPNTPSSGSRGFLIAEYANDGVNLTPACGDFNDSASSQFFSHAALTVNDESDWSLIRDPLTISSTAGYGLDAWRVDYGGSRTTTSVYRTPDHNQSVGGAAQSRHMYGDAADLLNQSGRLTEWQNMTAAAGKMPGEAQADFVEAQNGPCGTSCAHADWRSHAGGYSH